MKKSAIVTDTELSACATVVTEAVARATMVTTGDTLINIAGDANAKWQTGEMSQGKQGLHTSAPYRYAQR